MIEYLKNNEGLIYAIILILWIIVFFIAKHFGDKYALFDIGITLILIGYIFIMGSFGH
jgi:hypothetical protein